MEGKEPLSEEEDPDLVAKSQSKSSDGSDSDPDPGGYPSNHKLQLVLKGGDGSDSDPDSDGYPSHYTLQLLPKPCASSVKRPHEEGDPKLLLPAKPSASTGKHENKKSRTEETKPPCTPSGGLFTKLWSDEDEITLLNGMIDFRSRNAPNADFYKFIKEKLQGGFSRRQIGDKKRKLRDRFVNALNKCKSGSNPVFSKPHEEIIFELSKKIWANSCDGSKNKTTESKVKESNDGEKTEFWSKYPSFYESLHKMENSPSFSISDSGFSLMKERLSLIGSAKAKQVDEKWRHLIVKEMEIKCKEMELQMEIKRKQMELQCKQVEINNKMFALMTEQFNMAFDH